MKQSTKEFLLSAAVGAVIAAAVFALNFSRDYSVTRCLCDGLFVSAVMLLGIGGIRSVNNKGVFDVLGYGVKTTVETFIPLLRKDEKEDLHQYRERKAEERKSPRSMLLAGAAYLAASVAALGIYYAVK